VGRLLPPTRALELERLLTFDGDGGRALALGDTEYVVYIREARPALIDRENHGYTFTGNPIDGESTKGKSFKGLSLPGLSPERVARLGAARGGANATWQAMTILQLSSRVTIVLQEVESNSPKVAVHTSSSPGDITCASRRRSPPNSTRESRATRSHDVAWTGEVSAEKRPLLPRARHGSQGSLRRSGGIRQDFPATITCASW